MEAAKYTQGTRAGSPGRAPVGDEFEARSLEPVARPARRKLRCAPGARQAGAFARRDEDVDGARSQEQRSDQRKRVRLRDLGRYEAACVDDGERDQRGELARAYDQQVERGRNAYHEVERYGDVGYGRLGACGRACQRGEVDAAERCADGDSQRSLRSAPRAARLRIQGVLRGHASSDRRGFA